LILLLLGQGELCRSEEEHLKVPIMCPIKKVEGGENRFLIFPAVESMEGIKKLLSFICRMKIKGVIDQFSHAAVLGDFFH